MQADKSNCLTPWVSAFIGRTSAFIGHNFITDKWKKQGRAKHMKIYLSVPAMYYDQNATLIHSLCVSIKKMQVKCYIHLQTSCSMPKAILSMCLSGRYLCWPEFPLTRHSPTIMIMMTRIMEIRIIHIWKSQQTCKIMCQKLYINNLSRRVLKTQHQ